MMIVRRRGATMVSAAALVATLGGGLLLTLRQAGPTPVITGLSAVTGEQPRPDPTPAATPTETPATTPSQAPISPPTPTAEPVPAATPPRPAAWPTPQEIPDQLDKVEGEPCDTPGAYGRTTAGELLLCAYSSEADRGQWRRVAPGPAMMRW
jgi:hypothetical protein